MVEVVGLVRVMAEDQVEGRVIVVGMVKELVQDLKVNFKPVKFKLIAVRERATFDRTGQLKSHGGSNVPQTTSIIWVNRTFLLCNIYSSTLYSTVYGPGVRLLTNVGEFLCHQMSVFIS